MKQHIDTKLGVVVIIIIAITVGAFLWQWEKKQPNIEQPQVIIDTNKIILQQNQQQQGQPQLQVNADSSIMPEEIDKDYKNISTNEWKLFTDYKNGYSIKYPSNWTYKTKYGQEEGLFLYPKDYKIGERDNNLENLNGDYFIVISTYKGTGLHMADVKEWRKHDGNNYQEILINGNIALKFNADSFSPNVLRYYFIGNNNRYEITVYYKDTTDDMNKKIISTMNLLQ